MANNATSSPQGFLTQDYANIFHSLQKSFIDITGDSVYCSLSNEYITATDFSAKYSSKNCDLSCVHLNVQSLNSKLIEFINFVDEIGPVDVIALSEIWSTNLTYFCNILPNYYTVFVPPESSRVGGVGFLINKELNYKSLDNVGIQSSDDCKVESLFLNIFKKEVNFTVGAVYRHPAGNLDEFIKRTESCVNKIPIKNQAFLFGDFNINLINYNTETCVTKFVDSMIMNNFLPVILLPTRITPTSQTLIDHIYLREAASRLKSVSITAGNLIEKISDHLPIFCSLSFPLSRDVSQERPQIRIFNEKNHKLFSSKLAAVNWDLLLLDNLSPDLGYNNFISKITELHNESFPLTKLSRRSSKNKPWFTKDLRKSRSKVIRLYKKWLRTKMNQDLTAYTNYHKVYKLDLERNTISYYNNQFSLKVNGIKNIWKNLNQFLSNKNKSSGIQVDTLNINNNPISNPNDICTAFNNHFCKIGTSVLERLPAGTGNFYQYLGPPSSESIFVRPATADEISKFIDSMPINKSPGDDGITAQLIKRNKTWLVLPLLSIINSSLSSGQVPDRLKVAKIVPIFKKGDPTDPCNYRPISLLSIFDKILEKIVYSRILNFLDQKHFFYEHQFGFRKRHSTGEALMEAIDQCYKNIDLRNFVVGIYVDFEKAFDTVNHDMLLAKCYHYGLRGPMYKWLTSYLLGRKQFTVVNRCSSAVAPLVSGVPQGSILGPLLYLIYVNCIQNVSHDFKPRLFADDTNLFLIATKLNELQIKANLALDQLSNWCSANKLKINASKTCYSLYRSKKTISSPFDFKLVLNGLEIQQTQCSKYLGINIDDDLNWQTHINFLYSKLMKLCGILYKIKSFIPEETVKTIYYALVNSNIIYGIEIYANTYYSYIDKLIKVNNRIIRIVYNKSFYTHTKDLYSLINSLPIDKLHEYYLLSFVHKVLFDENMPLIFKNYFQKVEVDSQYSLRNSLSIKVIRFKTSFGQRCCLYKAAKLWNTLPSDVKSIRCYHTFCKAVKLYLRSLL